MLLVINTKIQGGSNNLPAADISEENKFPS